MRRNMGHDYEIFKTKTFNVAGITEEIIHFNIILKHTYHHGFGGWPRKGFNLYRILQDY